MGGGPPDPVRRCVGIGGGPVEPVEDWLDVRRCVGMGGGALLGDFVGGGAGAASFAMRAAIAEALPDDFGVFAAAFSFLAASSRAFALAIISATPIFGCARRRSEVLGHHPFLWVLSGAASTKVRGRLSRQHRVRADVFGARVGVRGAQKAARPARPS